MKKIIFPEIYVNDKNDKKVLLGEKRKDSWKIVLVYRGRHCPICTKYLNEFSEYREFLEKINVEIVAVSADSEKQLIEHEKELNTFYNIYYGLTKEHMKELGLYVTHPRSKEETDHDFSEPGLFVINENNEVHILEVATNPFVRPDILELLKGIKWMREVNYPIRGTAEV